MNYSLHDRRRRLFRLMALLLLAIPHALAPAAPINTDEAATRAQAWMEQHPLMGHLQREIRASESFPGGNAAYSVHVIRLAPSGYLILNSDDRLPLVVAFSEDAPLSLDDVPGNALRAFLQQHVAKAAEELAKPVADGTEEPLAAPAMMAAASGDELISPLLETTWNQCNPYNLLAPADPYGDSYYGYRAPTGCVATAFAQVLQFHRWPVRGVGSHSYSDDYGYITGSHVADFSDPYDWGEMRHAYDFNGNDPQTAKDAVAELMYELGVAAEADFDSLDSGGTSASTWDLGAQLGRHFHFGSAVNHSSQTTLLPAIHDDLRAGYPAVVSIPGHAVVADGMLISGGVTTYHINYGWGGTNNGWWAADSIAGDAMDGGVTSLRPKLMPYPVQETVTATGSSCELQWLLPKRREQEASHLKLYRRAVHAAPWATDASSFGLASATNWSVVPDGHSGSCWFAGPYGPATLDLQEAFIPDATTTLSFWLFYRLGTAAFTVEVSENDGASYNQLVSRNNDYLFVWQQENISLAAYAGKRIRLRFALSSGSYYTGGGVWVDEVAISSGSWESWETMADNLPLTSRRFSSVVTPWDEANDFTGFNKTSTSTYKDWIVTTLDNGGTGFYKEPGGYTNHFYHLTSDGTIQPTGATRLRIRGKYNLATDAFRVLVSTDRTNFTSVATYQGSSDWQDLSIDLGAFAGQSLYVRLEYVTGQSYYPNGGIWIDSVATEQVENPELEGQPLHLTQVGNLAPGTHQVAAAIIDTAQQEHPMSPAFTLQVSAATTHAVTFALGDHGSHAGGGALVQEVADGAAAFAPEVTPEPGWLFTGWDHAFDNITTDLTVNALYQAKLAAGGTPHWWFIMHELVPADAADSAFDLAETTDPLGKGVSLRDEFLFGTDPTDSSSRFQIGQVLVNGTQVSLHWTGRAGRVYRVLRSTSPAGQPWQETAVLSCETDAAPMSYSGNSDGAAAAFYRLGVSVTESANP